MVEGTAEDRRLVLAGKDTVGRAAHVWLVREFETEEFHQTPGLGETGGENGGSAAFRGGKIDLGLEREPVDGMVAAAAVEAG